MTLRKLWMAALLVALTASWAMADGIRDAGSKIRGNYDGGNWPPYRSTLQYSAPAPVNVTAAPLTQAVPAAPVAPPSVAQAPTERRSFSAEPQAAAVPQATAPMAAPMIAPAPMYRPSNTPKYLLPKTDGRRYDAF